jgi:class 3 adenylate cyclase
MKFLNSLSLQSKLLAVMVLLTLASIGTIAWIGYASARDSQRAAAERQLQGLQRSKASAVKTILAKSRSDVLAFSALPSVSQSATELLETYRQLADAPVTAEMDEAVRRFYRDEFHPALARRSAIKSPDGMFVPRTIPGRYLHYHYLARGPRPYTGAGNLESTDDSSAYGRALARIRPQLGASVERFGFDNVLLIDPVSMDVFYGQYASTILGTNLLEGPYASSNLATLAKALRTTQDLDDYQMADFEFYRPALGSPRAFVASPVFDGNRLVAIMAVRLPLDPIADALSGSRAWQAEGLGKSGETYLLGADLTMRSDARFLLEDPKSFIAALRRSSLTSRTVDEVERLGTTILTVPVKHAAALAALRGETGIMQVDDYRGVPVFMAYGPVDLDSVRWGVISKIDRSDAMQPLREYARRTLAAAVGLALVASLIALWLASVLTRPIADLVRGARRVSAGELDVEVPLAQASEYRVLGQAFNEMVGSLRTSRAELDRQVQETERLLLSLLPASAAAQMMEGRQDARTSFADVTVAYVSLLGIDATSGQLGEDASMKLLSEIVAAFDEAAEHLGVEKVRTIGSAYLAASGLSVERPDHTARMVEFARNVVRIVHRFNAERGLQIVAEVGINAGPVTGGLVGRRRFIYDLWGDTVKLAKGIESDGTTSIQVTRAVYERVRDHVGFGAPFRAEVRGMGTVELYPVLDEAGT